MGVRNNYSIAIISCVAEGNSSILCVAITVSTELIIWLLIFFQGYMKPLSVTPAQQNSGVDGTEKRDSWKNNFFEKLWFGWVDLTQQDFP